MFRRLIWVIDETPHPAPLNMAIDEALLLDGGDCPLLRAYRWLKRPVSIGYFSSWEQASRAYPGREIVRRWTGGGMVEHGDDFTYSLLLPAQGGPPPTRDLYRDVHTAIVLALAVKGRSAAIVSDRESGRVENRGSAIPVAACFDRSVENDVEVDGAKVAGAAIRRLRAGVILQGSIQRIPIDHGFAAELAQTLSDTIEKRMLSTVTTLLAERIANEKYGTESWTRRY
jgi:lipoate-protein ligase A